MQLTGIYSDGQWLTGSTELPVTDPASGRLITALSVASVEQCLEAVDAAARALPKWQSMSSRSRAEILMRAFTLLHAERDEFAERIVRENGKVLHEAYAEVGYAAEFFRWFSEEAVRLGGELRTAPNGDKRIVVVPQPIGVALLITPWNFPAAMATRKIAPALAAGCTVVLKPAPETPLTALALADLLERAGVPAGVVNVVVPEPPDEAVREMLAHSAVRKLSFTGSTEVGALLAAEAAPHLLRCSMELGGNAPFIIFDDADLEVAVEAALVAKLRNTGASCIAANRFYVAQGIAQSFTERFTAAMSAQRVASGLTPGAQVGALVSLEERDKVSDLVDAALASGGSVRTGGDSSGLSGAFYPPTVIDMVAPDNPILSEEIFGPAAPIVRFQDEQQVIEHANDCSVGLMAYVMTDNLSRGLRVAEALECGMVSINRGLISDPAAPFGGVKRSGLGKEGGHEGIEEYLERKYIAADW